MKLAILAAALLFAGASAGQAPPRGPAAADPAGRFDPVNVNRERPRCVPVARQLAGPRRGDGGVKRLDQLPPAQVILAVEREVDGCREVTLLSEERRRQGR